MDQSPVIVFDDQDVAYLYKAGKIIASSSNLDEIERLAADANFGQPYVTPDFAPTTQGAPGPTPACPNCGGGGCPQCQGGQSAQTNPMMNPGMNPVMGAKDHKKEREEENDKRTETDDVVNGSPTSDPIDRESSLHEATHIITPNGVKGKIVGRATGMFGTEVTVRLENGRIAKYDLVPGQEYKFENENAPKVSAYQHLKNILDHVPLITRASLLERIQELQTLQKEAKALAASAPYLDAQTLDDLIITAAHEMREAADVIQGLDQQEVQNPAFDWQAVEQASFGNEDASWLGDTLADAINQAQATDFDQMMNEGPESLISEVATPVLTDQEAVHNIANDYVTSKTVGLDPEAVKDFRHAFIQRVDEVRIKEANNRQEAKKRQAAQKTANRNEVPNAPDESLFI